jgi:hypothetical protein
MENLDSLLKLIPPDTKIADHLSAFLASYRNQLFNMESEIELHSWPDMPDTPAMIILKRNAANKAEEVAYIEKRLLNLLETSRAIIAIAHVYGTPLDGSNIKEWSDFWALYGEKYSHAKLLEDYKIYLRDTNRIHSSVSRRGDMVLIRTFLKSLALIKAKFPDALGRAESDYKKLVSNCSNVHGVGFMDGL